MTNEKRDPLKSLIRKVELDKPSLRFTDLVMEEVKAQNEAVTNPALKPLLKRNGVENPSIAFTQKVMAQVEALDSQTTYKSVIPKKVWLAMTSGMVFFVLYLCFSEETLKTPLGLTRYFIHIGNALSAVLTSVNSIPPLYPVIVISVSGLLVTDYLLQIRSQGQNSEK
jgi:hypothetical protein